MKGVLFDFDGVLIDSEHLYYTTWKKLLQGFKISFNRDDLIGKSNELFLSSLGICNLQLQKQLVLQKDEIIKNKISSFEINYELKDYIFNLNNRGIRIGVVSNNQSYIIEEFVSNNKLKMISNQSIFTIDRFRRIKPKPSGDLYKHALNRLELMRNEVIAVEDSQIGFDACNEAEINFLPFSYSNFSSSLNNLKLYINV